MSILNRFRIGPRLIFSFGTILLLLIVISLTAIFRLGAISDTTTTFIERDVTRVTVASRINSEAQSAAIILLELLSTEDRDDRVPLYRTIDAHNKNLDEAIAQLESLNVPEAEQIKTLRQEYQTAFTETVELLELSAEYAVSEFKDRTRPKLEELLSVLANLVDQQTANMQIQVDETNSANSAATTVVIIISLIATLLVVLLATLVSRSIVRPLTTIVQMAKDIAGGNIKTPPTIDGNDELSELNHAFREMCDGLQQLIQAIQDSSKEIHTSAEGLKEPVDLVKNASDHQHNAVSQIETVISGFIAQSQTAVATTQEIALYRTHSPMDIAKYGVTMLGTWSRI